MNAIILPWPHRDLSPNARVHWSVLASRKKKARADAHRAAQEAGAHKVRFTPPLLIQTVFCPPSRRDYDEDNLKARLKASYDGIADAIGVDDKHFRHMPIIIADPVKHGEVHVLIDNASEEAA